MKTRLTSILGFPGCKRGNVTNTSPTHKTPDTAGLTRRIAVNPIVQQGTVVSAKRPRVCASRRRSAGILTVMGAIVGLLCLQASPALPAEIKKGATILMQDNRPKSIYGSLQSERQILKFEALAIADATLPERIVLVSTVRSNEPPVGIAVHQHGPGTNDYIQIMIHGVLANHESWRYLTGPLSSNFDLWIIDLPGCGDSDKPDSKSLAADGYSPGAMADRVMQAIEQCMTSRNDSPRLLLVAHSLGGMIVLRMTSDPELRQRHAALLRQVDGLVLFAPGDVNVNQVSPVFKPIIKLGGLKAVIANALGILREAVAGSTRNGCASPCLATKETADQRYQILADAKQRRAAQAMIKEAVPWNYKENRPDWDGIHQLEANYRNVDKPCLIVWGACDEVLPESMGHKLADQIAGAKLVVLPDCMHAIALECPDACARLIRDFHASVRTACKREMPLPANSQIANDASSTTSTFYMANPKN